MPTPLDEFERFPQAAWFIPGTVCLPSLTTVGSLWLVSDEFKTRHGLDPHEPLLGIRPSPVQIKTPHQAWTYFVRLEQVSAIFFTVLPVLNFAAGHWVFKPTTAMLKDPKWQLDTRLQFGVVFVPENLPVVTHSTSGTTAGNIGEPVFQASADGVYGGCDRCH